MQGGGLYYPNLVSFPIIGTKAGTTRTAATLPATYDGTTLKSFKTHGFSEMIVDIIYTTGAAETNNTIQIKLEDSPDNVNFYRLTNEAASSGTSTLTQREFTFTGAAAATAYTLSYRLDISYQYMRIEMNEGGVAANAGTAYVEITLAGA